MADSLSSRWADLDNEWSHIFGFPPMATELHRAKMMSTMAAHLKDSSNGLHVSLAQSAQSEVLDFDLSDIFSLFYIEIVICIFDWMITTKFQKYEANVKQRTGFWDAWAMCNDSDSMMQKLGDIKIANPLLARNARADVCKILQEVCLQCILCPLITIS